LSFFDDDDDEPTRSTGAQPRRPSSGARTRSGGYGGGGGGMDAHERQQLLIRRAVAGGIGLLVLFVLIFGIKSCLDSSAESAMKDYNRAVTDIASSSDDEVAKPLFEALASGQDGNQLQVSLNQLRLVADENVDRAKGLDVPGDMEKAQQYLLLVLNLRAAAVSKIAALIPAATATTGDPTKAINQIAGQMQAFNASDVIFSQRVQPDMQQAFDGAGIGGQVIPSSRFLTNFGWLTPAFVAEALGTTLTASEDGSTGKAPSPGTHGHGLDSVSVGGTTLQPSPEPNRLPSTPPITFDVKFSNQGENNETRVAVTVTITGNGVKTITGQAVVATTNAGTAAEASVPITTAPPKNTPVKIEVEVKAVPGEKDTSNNKGSYDALFE